MSKKSEIIYRHQITKKTKGEIDVTVEWGLDLTMDEENIERVVGGLSALMGMLDGSIVEQEKARAAARKLLGDGLHEN